MSGAADTKALRTEGDLRALYGEPSPRVAAKELRRLDRHARGFIALSPFCVIASADAEGHPDATPRGDAPGFVAVLDDTTLLIPDRRGNARLDTMRNLVANPGIGLVFMVPGIAETLRVNGRATVTTGETLLRPLAAGGKAPAAGILIAIAEVYFHCGKALIRSDLWNPEKHVERSAFPSLGRIMADQIGAATGLDAETGERWIAEAYRDRLY